MNVEGFVVEYLPRRGSRVLEVGCGAGELASDLARRGHHVTAIDPHAPTGPIFRPVSLEEFDGDGPFDAVVANRSLHHIEDLSTALEKVARLLVPGGRLILNEFAFDRMDRRTAEWFAARIGEPNEHGYSSNAHEFLDQWKTEHDGLHDSTMLRAALDHVFQTEVFEWVPYLAQYRLDRPEMVEEEIGSIRSGEINPIGFRYVGSPLSLERA
jgi:ubiquinone/menaquinone biosynthesis C-methylase UbiE